MTRRFACEAIVFDLDGVLVNSPPAIERHWRHWADSQGLSFEQIMLVAHGMRTVDTIRLVAPHLNADEEAARIEALEVSDVLGLSAYDGAAELLRAIPRGLWAIATSGSRPLASARLRRTRLPTPEVLITSDDVRKGKPDPEVYLLAASRMQVPAVRCLAVEDSPAGLAAARSAGMTVIATVTTHSAPDLAHADAIVAGIWDLRVRIKSDDQTGEAAGAEVPRPIEVFTVS